jgi:peptidoglycan/xylan/chitin deacetylase (PgdA/CDA1 family)
MKKLLAFLYFGLIVAANLLPLSLNKALADSPNLIANPSVETATVSGTPDNWSQDKWGTNTTTFSYMDGGHTGSKSLYINMTARTNGDAKWAADPVAISSNTTYSYGEFYKSNTATELDAQYTDASGNISYSYLKTLPAAADWTQATATITAPATAVKVVILNIVYSVGWLQTDDYSLASGQAVSIPSVTLTAPANGSTQSGTVTLSASATDSSGIAGVQFKVDGVNIGSEDTAAPYQVNWDSTTVSNGTHNLTATARNLSNQTATSTPVQVTVSNTVSVPDGNLITNSSLETPDPANAQLPQGWSHMGWGTNTATYTYVKNGGHTGTHNAKIQITAYTDGDAKWFFNPVAITAGGQYSFSDYYKSDVATSLVAQYDDGAGNYTYQTLTTLTASSAWKQTSVIFTAPAGAKNATIFHLINSVGSLQIDDVSLAVSTVPTIAINSPTTNTILSGQTVVIATVSAPSGVSNIQFKLDGANLGTPITSAPFQTNWDTTQTANGAHSLTAVVTAKDGQMATSAAVNVTVSNQTGNMVPNPSMEITDPANSKLPADWQKSSWGTNTTTFTYVNTGHTGTHSLRLKMSAYTDGDVKWYFTPQAITPDTQYTYSDFYQSNIASEVDVAFTMSDGSTVYEFIGNPDPSASTWRQFKTNFSVPAGAVSATVFHLIHGVGTLTIDDASLQKYIPVGFSRPIVSITFDDGIASQYTYGLPILQKYGLNATFYIISGYVGQDGYMTVANVQGLYTAGEEIGSHTVDHPDLTSLTSAQVKTELSQSQSQLQQWLGVPVTNFAAPYGLVNTGVATQIKKYYQTERGIEYGFNDKASFNPYDIKVQDVDINTTTAQINDWVKQAKATNTWLVLVYHAVDPDSQTVGQYDVLPASLDSQLSAIKASGITVETMAQALAEITPQL